MDIKPRNIVYDKALDTVRMIDFGSSFSATQSVKLHKGTISIEGKLKELTIHFAAPEVLKRYKDLSSDTQLIFSSVDIYCWGMTFYSLLMKKKSDALLKDVETFKLKEKKEYQEYLNRIEKEFINYKQKADEETEMKAWMQKTILRSIAFLPEERPKFDTILSSLSESLRAILPYEKRAQEERQKLFEKIAGTNLRIEAVASSSAGASKAERAAEEDGKNLMKEVSVLRKKLQMSMDELNKNKEKNSKLEKSIHELQKKSEENQNLISQLIKERENQDFKIAELMSKDGNIKDEPAYTSQPAKGKEKALEENKAVGPSTPIKESEKVNITANHK